MSFLQSFSSKNVLTEHKVCFSINGAQSVILKTGKIKFNNYFKQLSVPFKIYADFECNLESVKSYEGSFSITFLLVLLKNLFVLMINILTQ